LGDAKTPTRKRVKQLAAHLLSGNVAKQELALVKLEQMEWAVQRIDG
jgi:hypothetical protein